MAYGALRGRCVAIGILAMDGVGGMRGTGRVGKASDNRQRRHRPISRVVLIVASRRTAAARACARQGRDFVQRQTRCCAGITMRPSIMTSRSAARFRQNDLRQGASRNGT